MRTFTLTGGRLLAALAALLIAKDAPAQFLQTSPQGQPQYYQGGAQSPAYGSQPAAYGQQAPAQQYAAQAMPAMGAQAGGYVPQPAYAPVSGFQAQAAPQYAAMAYQPYLMAQNDDDLSLSAPAEPVAPGPAQPMTPTPAAPAAPNYGGGMADYSAPAYQMPMSSAISGCSTGQCNVGGYGACDTSSYGYGACGAGYSTYGAGCSTGAVAGALHKGGCNYWFGGVYGLLMERDNGPKLPLAFAASGMMPGDYPTSDAVVLNTRAADEGFQGGFEVRIGRTFCCDPCTCMPRWGLEGAYWELFEEDDTAMYVDQAALRTYSMIDPRGIEADMGWTGGYRPVRDYYDYGPPVGDYSMPELIEVRVARVRTSFQARNVEVNLLRIGACGGGGYGAGYAGGFDACGCCPPNRYSCTGVCGFRYLELDEYFLYGVDVENTASGSTAYIDYNARTENDLYGFQIGCNGMYRIGCRWGLHLTSLVGIYGNDITSRQYMTSPTGMVRFIGTGENFDVTASKTDVSMLGELRLGASCQVSCKCRVYGGWRVVGVTGIALAADQHPSAFVDAAQLANYVQSNGSLLLHGLQAGVEWNY